MSRCHNLDKGPPILWSLTYIRLQVLPGLDVYSIKLECVSLYCIRQTQCLSVHRTRKEQDIQPCIFISCHLERLATQSASCHMQCSCQMKLGLNTECRAFAEMVCKSFYRPNLQRGGGGEHLVFWSLFEYKQKSQRDLNRLNLRQCPQLVACQGPTRVWSSKPPSARCPHRLPEQKPPASGMV